MTTCPFYLIFINTDLYTDTVYRGPSGFQSLPGTPAVETHLFTTVVGKWKPGGWWGGGWGMTGCVGLCYRQGFYITCGAFTGISLQLS